MVAGELARRLGSTGPSHARPIDGSAQTGGEILFSKIHFPQVARNALLCNARLVVTNISGFDVCPTVEHYLAAADRRTDGGVGSIPGG